MPKTESQIQLRKAIRVCNFRASKRIENNRKLLVKYQSQISATEIADLLIRYFSIYSPKLDYIML